MIVTIKWILLFIVVQYYNSLVCRCAPRAAPVAAAFPGHKYRQTRNYDTRELFPFDVERWRESRGARDQAAAGPAVRLSCHAYELQISSSLEVDQIYHFKFIKTT